MIDAASLTPLAESVDWAPVEEHLRMRLPSDYCELVDAGGAGVWFNDLSVYSPGDELKSHDLLESDGVFEDLLLAWEDDPEYRPADLPEDSCLIAWATTGHGETLFWRADADNTSGVYPIYVEDGDGVRWERFDLSTIDLLLGILHGDVTSQFFSDLFMDTSQVFRSQRRGDDQE
ncbi:hypothetical protein IHE71_22595 [Myceligenerans sp. TRM 65318]|uniref:Knr4/Smi1-like domain-containing protein n=1 Tax=Myceligenerans pegani TaxID=2776917 RepID=A0ABR9N490_9MICO|nr:hypothetical protein [Myceligenerans sp. TRM 65318]MBE1878490.1 hypothetical protein [Myceligenerans sp. TRM 65318]